uniref:Uncharacterized protein n=1 Tax=Myotis myotis TaxID=51298 RepID=A0A7J7RUU5_MYOMY|nr:hypothetical protein mMyoMyo1_010172 [Myotis myotis]
MPPRPILVPLKNNTQLYTISTSSEHTANTDDTHSPSSFQPPSTSSCASSARRQSISRLPNDALFPQVHLPSKRRGWDSLRLTLGTCDRTCTGCGRTSHLQPTMRSLQLMAVAVGQREGKRRPDLLPSVPLAQLSQLQRCPHCGLGILVVGAACAS